MGLRIAKVGLLIVSMGQGACTWISQDESREKSKDGKACEGNHCDDTIDCEEDEGLVHGEWMGDVTEADVPSFCEGYNCRSIGGNLIITDSTLSDMSALACLTSVGGSFSVSGDLANGGHASLVSLSGLNNLTTIGGNLSLGYFDSSGYEFLYYGNSSLTSLDGFERLTTIGGGLYIAYNDALTSLSGFESLVSVKNISIDHNNALTSLSGLDGITSVEEDLWVEDNPSLENLSGLQSLVSVNGRIGISYNASLESFSGIDALESVGGDFEIVDNDTMMSLSGLEHLETVGGSLIIGYNNDYGNTSLSSLPLERLESVGEDLFIVNNAALTSLADIDALTFVGGNLAIYDNLLLCEDEVDTLVDQLESFSGEVDNSGNGGVCP